MVSSQYFAECVYQYDYVNVKKLDAVKYYTTADGVEAVIMKKGKKILAEVCAGHFDCILQTINFT